MLRLQESLEQAGKRAGLVKPIQRHVVIPFCPDSADSGGNNSGAQYLFECSMPGRLAIAPTSR